METYCKSSRLSSVVVVSHLELDSLKMDMQSGTSVGKSFRNISLIDLSNSYGAHARVPY